MKNIGIFAWGFFLGWLLALALGCLKTQTTKKEYHEADIIHDGWCSLMPNCLDRCHCHDRCGPLCNTWRRLVYDGKVEPFGYEWTFNDPTGLVECIVRNSKRGKKMNDRLRKSKYKKARGGER